MFPIISHVNVQNTLTRAYFTPDYSTFFSRGMPKGQDIHAIAYRRNMLVGNAQWLRYTCKSIQKDYLSLSGGVVIGNKMLEFLAL